MVKRMCHNRHLVECRVSKWMNMIELIDKLACVSHEFLSPTGLSEKTSVPQRVCATHLLLPPFLPTLTLSYHIDMIFTLSISTLVVVQLAVHSHLLFTSCYLFHILPQSITSY
jgi:hypothetical protein